ncbi:two-component system activity regulator YycH [Bacillus paramycoides]|uniref:YycH family regulatory protein n=1 Tax=Bacillus paramycoides TaxID=2026194 RepID=UPI00224367BB|nr:two-component system activity regulator YycH [Bacillus paramycoides]MCW9133155.1 two-component system activity regulator YycH [Bacillus paramycoides]
MSMENFKTIVLINLVVISLFLTFNLWTYVPDSTSMQNTKFVQGNEDINPIKISEIVRPSSVIIHKEKNHYVSENKENVDSIYKILENGELHDFREITGSVPKGDFLSYVHGEEKIEFVFPTNIPLDTIKSMFNIKDKNIESNRSFNRIIIDPSRSKDQEIKVNFVSYDTSRKIYQATLTGAYVKDILNAQNQLITVARPYFEYQINDTKKLFLPDGITELSKVEYITSKLEVDTFKNALFSDPRYLSPISEKTKETFTDGIRSMEIDKSNAMLKYKNSAVHSDKTTDNAIILQKSFDFVSGHSGTLKFYRFDYISKGKTSFRLYEGGLPVFNADGIAELKQAWGSGEVMQYERPLYNLSFSLPNKQPTTSLASGHTVMTSLENNPEIDKNSIQDVGIGYKLSLEPSINARTMGILQPIWYVKYDEEGKQQIFEWSEGGLNGLGSN